MNVSANSLICVPFHPLRTSALVTLFLNICRENKVLTFCFPVVVWFRRNTQGEFHSCNTGHGEVIPAVIFSLPQRKTRPSAYGRLPQTVFTGLDFQFCLDGVACSKSLWSGWEGWSFFFPLKKKKKKKQDSVSLYYRLYFPCVMDLNLKGSQHGFSKIISSKSCQCSFRSVGRHRVQADIDLVMSKLHLTLLFSDYLVQMWWLSDHADNWFCCNHTIWRMVVPLWKNMSVETHSA